MKAYIAIALLFFFTKSGAQISKLSKEDIIKAFYSTETPSNKFDIRIPFRQDIIEGAIVIECAIQGVVFHFIYDSGASSTIISNRISDNIKLKAINGATIRISDNKNNEQRENVYLVEQIIIGGISFKNIGCLVADLSKFDSLTCSDLKIDGIIGANLMRACFWNIDFNKSELRFYNRYEKPSKEAIVLSFKEGFGGVPKVSLKYKDTTINAVFDLGNNGLIRIPKNIFKSILYDPKQLAICNGYLTQSFYGSVQNEETYRIREDSLVLGGITLKPQLLDIANDNQASVGNSFIKKYLTTIDWVHHQICLQPINNSSIDINYLSVFGIKFLWKNNKAIVASVWNNSDAEKNGIKVGMTLLAINNQKLNNASDVCNVRSTLKNETHMRVVYLDDKQNETVVELSKYSLF